MYYFLHLFRMLALIMHNNPMYNRSLGKRLIKAGTMAGCLLYKEMGSTRMCSGIRVFLFSFFRGIKKLYGP